MPANIVGDVARSGGDGGRIKLYYRANQVPSPPKALLFGFQQVMVCISGLLVTPFVLSNTVCAGTATAFIRVRLISTTLVVAGISTFLQNTIGVRLPLLQGPSFAYLPPIFAFSSLPEFMCNSTANDVVPEEDYLLRLTTIQGGLMGASFVQMMIGFTGLIGLITRFIGPLTIAPLMLLLLLSVVGTVLGNVEQHWVSVIQIVVLIIIIMYLAGVKVPIPVISKRRIHFTGMPVFTLFPYLLSIGICWLLCYILTVTNLEPPGGAARTDQNDTTSVLREAPWIRVPYPGQWGKLGWHTGVFLGFVAAAVSSLVESVGAYHTCSRIADERPPPAHAVNRGITIEGIGVLLAGGFGSGVGVTTYSENIGCINITKVASRATLQIAGIMMIILGILTKFGAVLATIPEPLIGGILTVSMSVVGGVGLSSLQLVDLKLSRNVAILGFSIMCGMLIPAYFTAHPVNTSVVDLNQVLNILLTINMFMGGLVAFILDNTVPGATRAQRGLHAHASLSSDDQPVVDDAYSFPAFVTRILNKIPGARFVPIFPPIPKPPEIKYPEPPPLYNYTISVPPK